MMMTGWWLATGMTCLALATAVGKWWPRTWLALVLTGTAAAVMAAGCGAAAGGWQWQPAMMLGGEPLHLRIDGLSGWFMILTAVVGGLGAVYARGYGAPRAGAAASSAGRGWWAALVLSMLLVLTVSNGLHFLMAWEAFAVSGYFLITLDRTKPAVRAAGWLYLVASHAGTACLFAFFTLLAARCGGWDLGPVRELAGLAPLWWLALAGFGLKAGFFPLHVWLPAAHANAPSHVSAIMSGVAIKMGVYGIMRFSGWLPVPAAGGWVVLGVGATSALLGIAFALAQNDYKRLLAYSSVENVGIILVGVGTAMVARGHGDAAWGRLALAGALWHVWNHGAFKSLLFFGAGSVLHATGTRDLSRLGGLWRQMPWTAGLFLVGALAVAALPPLNGFVSEWLIYLGLLGPVTSYHQAAWLAMPAAIALAMAGALALAAFVKAGAMMFLGSARSKPAASAHECNGWMRAAMLAMAGLCLLLGWAPLVIWPLVMMADGSWNPAWAGAPAPASLMNLAWVQPALAGVMVAGAILLWRQVRSGLWRRGLTWDCGYAVPTARMQYTSGSFGGLASGWFHLILRPQRTVHRPRGYLPVAAIRLERVPETVLEQLLVPLAARVMQVSTTVRRLQHGRVGAYILYVVAGLTGLAILVLLESVP